MGDEKKEEPQFIDPNSGAAPQPGGFVSGQAPAEEESAEEPKKTSESGKTAKKAASSGSSSDKS